MIKRSAFTLALLIGTLAAPAYAEKVGQANVSGIVNHISDGNIKITTAAGQQLSFLLVPHFDQVFTADGKGTYQMKAIKPGQYVKIYYDQKLLGARHADRILVLNQSNTVKGVQKS